MLVIARCLYFWDYMPDTLKEKYFKETKLSPIAHNSDMIQYSQQYVDWLESQVIDDSPEMLQLRSMMRHPKFKSVTVTLKSKK